MTHHRRHAARLTVAALAVAVAGGCTTQPNAAPDPDRTPSPQPSPTAQASTTQPTPPAFEPRTFTVVMSGDVLLHSGLWYSAQLDAQRTGRGAMDFRPLLAGMRPVIRGADLAICHLETPLAPKGGPYASYPVFSAPPAIAPALTWAGYDACTTASNHSLDQGYSGLQRTQRMLTAAGLRHTGTATSRREARLPLIVEVDGVRVALISATYGTNGIPIPDEAPWSVPLLKAGQILAEAKRARQLGADVVLVALHWGLEYQTEPSGDQVALARRLLQSRVIDLVYGHHAHVVQPFDKVRGKWVAYGLGNAVAQQDTTIPGLYDGVTARFTFTELRSGRFRVSQAEYVPTYVTPALAERPRMRWLDIVAKLRDPQTSPELRVELRAALSRVRTAVSLLHARRLGLRIGH